MRRCGIALLLFVIVLATPTPVSAYDLDIPGLSWRWLYYDSIGAGVGIYGSVTVESGKDITFFVVDKDNYDEIAVWGILADFTMAKDWGERSGTFSFTFITPYADSWYFCWSNYDSLLSTDVSGSISIDYTAPTITILSPSSSQVSGTVTISASASDAHFSVYRMRIYVDDYLKSSIIGSSISYSWDTTTVSDGSHTIKYYASDTVGNSRTLTRSVTVDNSPAATTSTSSTNNTQSMILANSVIAIGLLGLCALIAVGFLTIRKKKETPARLVQKDPSRKVCPYCGYPCSTFEKKCRNCHGNLWDK